MFLSEVIHEKNYFSILMNITRENREGEVNTEHIYYIYFTGGFLITVS